MGYRKAILRRLEKADRLHYRIEPSSVGKAAKHLNLDPNNPHDRERLLYILAEALFAPAKKGRRAGVKLYWHKLRLINLGRLYSIEIDKSPKLKNAEIARRISKHPDFKNDDPDQIRQRLPWAHELFQEWWLGSWDLVSIPDDYAAEHGEPDEFEEPPEYDF
jgi:hypothetical protein